MADIKLFLQSYSGQEDDQDDDVDGKGDFLATMYKLAS